MSKSAWRSGLAVVCAAGAGALLLFSLRLPMWGLRMEAPQYQAEEALRVLVYPGSMRGDLRELDILNQYIGVRLPKSLPQSRWIPAVLLGGAVLGIIAALLPGRWRRGSLLAVAGIISALMLLAAVQAQLQMREIGHNRDHHAALQGVGDFTPPLLGRAKIANFEISAGLRVGALLIAAGVLLQAGAGFLARPAASRAAADESLAAAPA